MFTNEKGGLVDKDNWRHRIFNKVLEKAELRRIRIHDLRHTYATLRISKCDNIADVSAQLGHHAVKLTLDVYNHWLPGKKKSQVDALDSMHLDAPYTHLGKEKGLGENAQTLNQSGGDDPVASDGTTFPPKSAGRSNQQQR